MQNLKNFNDDGEPSHKALSCVKRPHKLRRIDNKKRKLSMKFKSLGAASSVALLFSAAQALAVTIAVDTFDTDQSVSDPGAPSSSTVTSAGGDILGGTRTLTATNSTGGTVNATALDVAGGSLSFSNKAGSTGMGSLFYNGGGLGLGDLSIGENPFFFFDVAFFDNDNNVRIDVNGVDQSGNEIFFTENVSTGFNPNLFFTEFDGFDDFDFDNVASLEFLVDTTGLTENIDGALNAITINADMAAIPLPASALLLLSGFGGMALIRRRRKT